MPVQGFDRVAQTIRWMVSEVSAVQMWAIILLRVRSGRAMVKRFQWRRARLTVHLRRIECCDRGGLPHQTRVHECVYCNGRSSEAESSKGACDYWQESHWQGAQSKRWYLKREGRESFVSVAALGKDYQRGHQPNYTVTKKGAGKKLTVWLTASKPRYATVVMTLNKK